MADPEQPAGSYASPPCFAGASAPGGSDPQQALEVARWRKAERIRLLAQRAALPVDTRRNVAHAIAAHLDTLMAAHIGDLANSVVSGYWPIKAEPDLRDWMARLCASGAALALPVVEQRAAPLLFRPWAPDAAMTRGHWNILVPDTTLAVRPDVSLAPLVGWDGQGYRLGYGGGYFDRTLASADPRPFTIGVGFDAARLATIFPQPHDIGLDAIVTESGVQFSNR